MATDPWSGRLDSFVPTYRPLPIEIVSGQGSVVTDADGRELLDLTAGIAVSSLGHRHPALMAALSEQANRIWHLSNVYANGPAAELADELCRLTFAERVYFSNSGAEANEAALKLARRYAHDRHGADKFEIVALHRAFHGRTLFTVTAGGKREYSDGFGPRPEGIVHVEPDDIDELRAAVGSRTCAVIMEPVLGEGGVVPLGAEYLRAAREVCNAHGALLIFDEVQTGVGRTGSLFAYQSFGVTPDVLTSAKGLGGGFPIGATLTTGEIGDVLARGTHGSTFGGNPLASSVARAVLAEVTRPELIDNVAKRHDQIVAGIADIAERTGVFAPARGMGLLLGVPLTPAYEGRSRDVLLAGLEVGVLVLAAGLDVVRLAPALTITEAETAEALARLEAAVRSLGGVGT